MDRKFYSQFFQKFNSIIYGTCIQWPFVMSVSCHMRNVWKLCFPFRATRVHDREKNRSDKYHGGVD